MNLIFFLLRNACSQETVRSMLQALMLDMRNLASYIIRVAFRWCVWGVILQVIQESGIYDIKNSLPFIYDAGTLMIPVFENLSKFALALKEHFGL